MGIVVKLSVARKKREKREKEQQTKLFQGYFETLYWRSLTANEKKIIAGMSEDELIDELIYRHRIAEETNLVPWASDEEVEAWNQKYFFKKRDR